MAPAGDDDLVDEPGDMEEALGEWLEAIDRALSHSHLPIPTRPFEAARVFIERALIAVDDEEIDASSLDKHLDSPWFKKLYGAVHKWYEDKYGTALKRPDSYLTGVAMISGAPFELRIPTTLRRVEVPGETAWLTFPAEVQDSEDPRSWIRHGPTLARLSSTEADELTSLLRELGTRLRTIRLDLSWATKRDAVSQALSEKAVSHLEAAANHILRHDRGMYGLAAWESHQVPESVLKLLRRQSAGTHRTSHDLLDLLGDLEPATQQRIDRTLVESIPNGTRIVQLRAGEGATVTLGDVYRIYRTSIAVAFQAAHCLAFKMRAHNASFLLRKAPWIG